jgi:hypothetical protein
VWARKRIRWGSAEGSTGASLACCFPGNQCFLMWPLSTWPERNIVLQSAHTCRATGSADSWTWRSWSWLTAEAATTDEDESNGGRELRLSPGRIIFTIPLFE